MVRKEASTDDRSVVRVTAELSPMVPKNRPRWTSPARIFRRGAIVILATYFFVNGLFKGGLTVLFLIAFLGDNWVSRHDWGTIGIAFLVGVGILFPLGLLMRKEDWWIVG
jgi:hypothetical protein